MARRWRAVCWALALVVCAAGVTRCGSSTPAPSGVTTTTATTSAVTTTSVAPITSAHYAGTLVQTPPLPPVPLDLSLFFQVPGGSLRPGFRPQAVNFLVTGGYSTGPGGFSGDISGTLDGTPANGTFTGTMTANLTNGCIAKRNYSGPLSSAALNWTPGDQIENCGGASPLTFTVTPPAAPTPATTSLPTTSTIGACTFGLSIGSTIDGYPTGGTFSATVTTQAGCAWTATSNAPWIHITADQCRQRDRNGHVHGGRESDARPHRDADHRRSDHHLQSRHHEHHHDVDQHDDVRLDHDHHQRGLTIVDHDRRRGPR